MARPDASVPSLLLLSLALELLPESTSVAGEAEAEVLGDACGLGVRVAAADAATAAPLPPLVLPPPWLVKL